MAPILEVKNLHHIYSAGTPFEHAALEDVSFSVEAGEFIGVIGHTGSGKSTLMQHMNGLLKPTSGQILLDGKDIWSDKATTRPIKDMKIIYEAYTTRGKLIDSKTVYSSSDGTYTVESSGYTSEINCILKASDSSDTYAESTVELNVDWNGSPFNKATRTFFVNNCNFYMKRK